jgi:hypothetical protein
MSDAICGPDDRTLDAWARHIDRTLDAWARHIDRTIPPGRPAAWIRLWDHPGSAARGSDPLPGPDDVEILLDLCGMMGWLAPPTCVAIAVVADGTVQPEHPAVPAGEAPPVGVRVVCLVERSGRVAARIHLDGRPTSLEPPSGGRLLDCMLRAFGLPTPPPTAPSMILVERIWLGAVVDASRDGMVALGWEQVRRLHPAVAVLESQGLEMTDDLVDAALRLAPATWTWEWLRQQTAEGRWGVDLVAPELADWMDEGMFSRWVLEETRRSTDLLHEAAPGVSTAALHRLERIVG